MSGAAMGPRPVPQATTVSPGWKEKVEELTQSAAATIVGKADQFYAQKDLEHSGKLYEQALTQPGSTADHARAYFGLAHVALLRNDPEKAERYGAAGRKRVEEKFAWSAIAKQTIALYRQLIDEHRKAFTRT